MKKYVVKVEFEKVEDSFFGFENNSDVIENIEVEARNKIEAEKQAFDIVSEYEEPFCIISVEVKK